MLSHFLTAEPTTELVPPSAGLPAASVRFGIGVSLSCLAHCVRSWDTASLRPRMRFEVDELGMPI